MRRVILTAIALALIGAGARSADEKGASTDGVREDFKRFAAAVREDKYDEAAKWIVPPADKHWAAFVAMLPAAAKYNAALATKFGRDATPVFEEFTKTGGVAEHFYEVRGEVEEVKAAGKDRVHVRVWTKRPEMGKPKEEAFYERKITAVKIGDAWKFHLHDIAGGTPVVKKVKRTKDGKEIEVYAEHSRKGGIEVELAPIDRSDLVEPHAPAVFLAKALEILPGQTELVLKGTYSTNKEALNVLEETIREAVEKSMPRKK